MTEPVSTSPLNVATYALGEALVAVWRECDKLEYRLPNGEAAGENLPGELSLALGLAARELGAVADREDDAVARALLVRHRPGSWEAQHVRAMMASLEFLPAESQT